MAAPATPAPDGARLALRTLGALSVSGDGDAERAAALADLNARPRALAVLVRLAMAEGPVSRDLLADEFWGDRDPERARHSLADALSAIRRAFGRDSVSLRSQQLVFKPDPRLVVDALEFTRAVQAGRDAEAVALYRGAFLDGVFIDRAPRFDQWAMQRRFTVREQFVGVAAREWRRLAESGAHAAAASVAMRWQAEAPGDAEPTRALLESLSAPGSASALRRALEAWAEHQRALAAEDDAPDPALAAYAESLAAAYAAMPPAPAAAAWDPTPRRTPPPAGSPPADAPSVPARHRPAWPIVGGVGAMVIGAAAIIALRPTTPTAPPWVVVTEAEVAGVDSAAVGAVVLATRTALESDGRLLVLPSARALELARLSDPDARAVTAAVAPTVARRSAAAATIVPVIVQSGRRVRVAMRVVTADGAAQVTQGLDVPQDSLLFALDRLVAEVRARIPSRAATTMRPLPDVATRSLPALAAYAQGQTAADAGSLNAAIAAYREATALDSTFAIAHASLGSLLYVLNRPDEGEAAFRRAKALLPGIPLRDRVLVESAMAVAHGDHDIAIRTYQQWLSQHPYDRTTRSRLALAYMRANRKDESAREYRRILAEDSLNGDAWIDLAKVLTESPTTRDSAAAAMQRGLTLLPTRLADVYTVQSFGNLLVMSGRPDSAAAVFRLLTTRDSSLAGRGYRWLGMLSLWEGRPSRASGELERAIALQSREPLSDLRSRWLAAMAYDMQGDRTAFNRTLDAMVALTRHPDLVEPRLLWYTGALLARAGRVAEARVVLDLLRRRMVPESRTHRAAARMLEAEVAGAAGDAPRAVALAREGVATDGFVMAQEGLAFAHWRAGQVDSSRAVLQAIGRLEPTFGWEGALIQRLSVLALTAAETAAGDTATARPRRAAWLRGHPRAEPAFVTWSNAAGFLPHTATSARAAP